MKGKSVQEDDSARGLALDVLLWIAADEERVLRFLDATGSSPDAPRARLGDPVFLAAVLDHVADDEAALVACGRSLGVDPERIAAAWRSLSPPPVDNWA